MSFLEDGKFDSKVFKVAHTTFLQLPQSPSQQICPQSFFNDSSNMWTNLSHNSNHKLSYVLA
jgi:hypothetical protein